jgi:hypothetical protein
MQPGLDNQKGERPMARVLIAAAYAAVALYFLRGYRPRPTLLGVIVSVLWPVSLAIAVGALTTIDEDMLSL